MENFTESTTTASPKRIFATSQFGIKYNGQKIWLGCEVVLCFMTIVLIYVAFCISRYAWTLKSVTRVRRSTLTDSASNGVESLTQTSRVPSVSSSKKYKLIMAYTCLFASVVAITKFFVDQSKFFYAWTQRDDVVCEIIYDITDNIMFSVSFLSVYGFLWLKQWMFYRDPAVIGILYNKKLVLFSTIFGPVVLILGLACVISNIIPKRFNAGKSYARYGDVEALYDDETYLGCVAVYAYMDEDQVLPLMSYAAITAIFQTVLLGLFAYPIVRQKIDLLRVSKKQRLSLTTSRSVSKESIVKRLKISNTVSEGDSPHSEATVKERDQSIPYNSTGKIANCGSVYDSYTAFMYRPSPDAMRPIKRAVLWTSICIGTDATLFAIFASLGEGTPLILVTLAQDIDLFFNILCCVATYNTWRDILFPIRKSQPNRTESKIFGAASLIKASSNVLNV